jgi:hypothetical protein
MQHNTAQHIAEQHNTTQHNTTQHNTTQHSTTQHSTAQHSTAQLTQCSAVTDLKTKLGRATFWIQGINFEGRIFIIWRDFWIYHIPYESNCYVFQLVIISKNLFFCAWKISLTTLLLMSFRMFKPDETCGDHIGMTSLIIHWQISEGREVTKN